LRPLDALRTVFAIATLAAAPAAVPDPDTLAIINVTAIDAAGGPARPGVNVLVRDGRIVSVENAAISMPPDTRQVDGAGKFLIPGLWDMHVHLSWSGESALPVLLANGVTGVRDMGGKLDEIDAWRARIGLGALAGPPRIVRAGPILNGKAFNPLQVLADSPEEARGLVRALKHVGVDFIKVHRRIQREVYFAVLDEAKKLELRVVGHVPMTVTPLEASAAGQASLEHAETFYEGTFSEKLPAGELPSAIARYLATPNADELFLELARNGTVVTPTLVGYRSLLDIFAWSKTGDPNARFVAASLRGQGIEQARAAKPEEIATVERTYAQLKETIRRMIAEGVPMMTGTDLAGPRVPGFPVHDELQLLVEAGLSPLQALRAATLQPAKFLGKEADLGTIAAGKRADLVLLDADPLSDIRNTRRITAVIAAGKLYSRADLDRLLEESVRLAAAH